MPHNVFKLTVTLEAVTPLFLGGANPRGAPELRASPLQAQVRSPRANPRGAPELRAPSFRGAMRYWMRA